MSPRTGIRMSKFLKCWCVNTVHNSANSVNDEQVSIWLENLDLNAC